MISKQIKTRLQRAGKRFHAADNISEFMHEGDHEELIEELTDKFQGVLESLVIDVDNDPNSIDTSRRLAKMYINEIMSGRYNDMPKVTSFPNEGQYDQLIIVRSDIKSMCSHHHQPVTGICYIACLPGENVIGLSKYTDVIVTR